MKFVFVSTTARSGGSETAGLVGLIASTVTICPVDRGSARRWFALSRILFSAMFGYIASTSGGPTVRCGFDRAAAGRPLTLSERRST